LTKTRSLANYSDRQYVFCVGIVGITYLDLAQVSDDYFGCDSAPRRSDASVVPR